MPRFEQVMKALRPGLYIVVKKAILTKPSEKRERPVKAAKPIKAGTKANDAKTGTPRYGYPGAKGKGKMPARPPVQVPQPPPQLNVEEVASVLRTTTGALKEYAKVFKNSAQFSSYFQQKAGHFLLKHRIGSDKLRRLYEQLREGDTRSPRV